MNEVIPAALVWIAANSGYQVTEPPRFIVELSDADMASVAIGRSMSERTFAIYSCRDQTIWLCADADYEGDDFARSVAVHELVHHAQCVTHGGIWSRCKAEREAYGLQARYLHEHYPDRPDAVERFEGWARGIVAEACAR